MRDRQIVSDDEGVRRADGNQVSSQPLYGLVTK